MRLGFQLMILERLIFRKGVSSVKEISNRIKKCRKFNLSILAAPTADLKTEEGSDLTQ